MTPIIFEVKLSDETRFTRDMVNRRVSLAIGLGGGEAIHIARRIITIDFFRRREIIFFAKILAGAASDRGTVFS